MYGFVFDCCQVSNSLSKTGSLAISDKQTGVNHTEDIFTGRQLLNSLGDFNGRSNCRPKEYVPRLVFTNVGGLRVVIGLKVVLNLYSQRVPSLDIGHNYLRQQFRYVCIFYGLS